MCGDWSLQVQRAETVLASPWELGSSAEYGHLSLLNKILTEAEKLDVAEHNPNVGDVHLPQAALKMVAVATNCSPNLDGQ